MVFCCRYYRMIVISLKEGQDPGNSADITYETITRKYEDQVEGEPYITAEFENEGSRKTFPVGDGKYYSRSGITEARRKRRAVPGKFVITTRKPSGTISYCYSSLKKEKDFSRF